MMHSNLNTLYDNLLEDDNENLEQIFTEKSKKMLKRKRQRKTNREFNNCTIKEALNNSNTGNIILKEIPHNESFKLFIAKVKEVFFNTNKALFIKGRENLNNNTDDYEEGEDNYISNIPNMANMANMTNMSSPPCDPASIPNINFWNQRYYYFSKFDLGIKLDYESWYSVTPEEISVYIAKFCKDLIVVDAFCGSGGNTIQFSKFCKKVYANDIDHNKIDLCKNNARVYNCTDNIEFLTSDYLKIKEVMPHLKSDLVFLSPPWGGMDYKSTDKYSLKQWVTPDIEEIIRVSLSLSENLVFYLPRNTDIEELLSYLAGVKSSKEIEEEEGEINSEDDSEEEEDPCLYVEVQMLKSANKVKAILVLFGKKYNKISIKEIRNYLSSIYPKIEQYQLCQLVNLTKVIGVSRFFQYEYNYRKTNKNKNRPIYNMIKHIKEEVLSEDELTEFNKIDKKNKADLKIPEKSIINIFELQSEENFNELKSNAI